MLAEAIHSVADTGNQSLLFLGGRRAQRAESKLHPFGYGRERYFWGFVVALVLFSLGAVFATYEGVEKLIHPHELDDPAIAFAVLGIAIVPRALLVPHCHPRSQPRARRPRMVGVHPDLEESRAPRRAARGPRRPHRTLASRSLA